jgi:ATP-dependent Clp protease protease subunit
MLTGDGYGVSRADAMRARLFERRVVVLDGDLDDATAGRIAAELMTLDALGDERVDLLLNSGTGTLEAAFTVMDVVDLLGVPVHVTCVGRAEGPSLGVLAVGTHRAAVPHATLRLSVPANGYSGRAADVVRWAAEQHRQLERFAERLAAATSRPVAWLVDALHERRLVEPAEAIRLGIVDEIARANVATIHRLDDHPAPGRRLGFQPGRSRS